MIEFLIKSMQIFNTESYEHEESRVYAENEYLAMSCGSLNPRLLAEIKRCQAEHHRE